MRFLYIFPHPDDESFGPVAVMNQQLEEGHEVHLLTLTKGGATQVRHQLNLSIEEMGKLRHKEMLCVEKTLGLTSMTVLDMPDSGMAEMDPRVIERVVREYIEKFQAEVVVTYPVHGISGFHDHLVMHAVAKRVFLEMRDEGILYLKRLAFLTVKDEGGPTWMEGGRAIRIKRSAEDKIDCVVPLRWQDIEMMKKCLACYESYQKTIKDSNVVGIIGDKLHFEIYGESHQPPLSSLLEGLTD